MNALLDRILAARRADAAALAPAPPRDPRRIARDVPGALRRPRGAALRIIAEIKHRSPSAGPLSRALSPAARAIAYEEAGAAMVSVLCEPRFFDGSFEDLEAASLAVRLPVLCKDFVVHPAQVERAWSAGADAVLLVVRCLPEGDLRALASLARSRGIEPLFEVADESELARAIAAEAAVVGVNARDLDTLTIDPARAARVVGAVPDGIVAVHLSGLRDPAGAARVAATRADAALVGEALMREDDPRPLLRRLRLAARAPDRGGP